MRAFEYSESLFCNHALRKRLFCCLRLLSW